MKKVIKLTKKDLSEIVKRSLKNIVTEQTASKEKVEIPDSCFGGPKTGLGGLILFTTMLQKEHDNGDHNSGQLISDMKTFLKGMNKANPEMIARLLKKYNKEKYLPWVGCF
jgi:hypothetical protein